MRSAILMHPARVFLLSMLFLACLAVPASAERVNFYVGSLPPYAFLEGSGPPTGIAVELLQEMMQAMGEP